MPRGLKTRNNPANRRRHHKIDPPEGGRGFFRQRSAEALGPRRILEHERFLKENRAAQAGGQNEMSLQ